MKVLITGGSGLLGQYLNLVLSRNHKILTLYNSNIGNCKDYFSKKISLTDFNSIKNIFEEFNPQLVIHTAAISNPNNCDKLSPKVVYETNVNASQKIAEFCDKYSAKLFYTSTDLVYAGYRGQELKEDAKLNPVSLYAETKLMAEEKIKNTFDNYVILRVALQFGFGLNHSTNHFQEAYNKLLNNEEVPLFVDQYRSPLSLIDSARMINELVDTDIKNEIINFGGSKRLSRYELFEILCRVKKLNKDLLVPKKLEEVNIDYKVADVSMNIDKLKSFNITTKSIEDSLMELFDK